MYESLVLEQPPSQIVEAHQQINAEDSMRAVQDPITPEVVAILEQIERNYDELVAAIAEASNAKSLLTIPKTDLAILLVLATEIQQGLDIKVAVSQGNRLAADFGGTDKSPNFIQAVLSVLADNLADNSSVKKHSGKKDTVQIGNTGVA
jgi:transcription termination factor NusB